MGTQSGFSLCVGRKGLGRLECGRCLVEWVGKGVGPPVDLKREGLCSDVCTSGAHVS